MSARVVKTTVDSIDFGHHQYKSVQVRVPNNWREGDPVVIVDAATWERREEAVELLRFEHRGCGETECGTCALLAEIDKGGT